MKKIIGLFLSLIVLMSSSAYNAEEPAGPQKPNPGESMCLTFVSSGKSTIALIKEGEPYEITLEYSVDGGVWDPYTIGETVELADGGELMFRAGEDGNDKFSAGYENYYKFVISGKVDSKGNVMSLLDRDCKADSVPEAGFIYLFANCDGLMSTPVLPAKSLAPGCYLAMFAGCTNLTEAPALPAMELAAGCYSSMFNGCMGLTEAPELPAMKLVPNCYSNMFTYCTSLTETPALPATELAMMCYYCMFSGCTSLMKAPALPATELASRCYYRMFYGCTNLNYVKSLFTDEPSEEATYNWLSGVSSTGTFVKSKDATWDVRGDDGIPEGWTVEIE